MPPIILLFLVNRRRKLNDSLQIAPGPFSWPIIGNVLDLDAKKPHFSLVNLAKSYGPIFSLKFGARSVVVVSSSTAAREIYKVHDREFSGRYVPQLADRIPQVYNSAIAMSKECDERWRFLRSTAHTELFSSQALESNSKFRFQQTKKMLDFLGSKEGEVVKIADVLFATISNGLTNAMVSKDIVDCWSKSGEVKKTTKRVIEFFTPGIADLYPALLGGLDFWSKQKAADFININVEMWGNIVSKRRERQNVGVISSRDFLDVLIQNSFDDYQIYNFLYLLLASLFNTFDWLHPPGLDSSNLDMSEKFGITLAKEKPLLLIPKFREPPTN
ncbi:hypothetical protein ACH5RR_019649 [Cinchona calisaya]|uniref:Cytochrome P450 n=1 Tax=Cinchona calisaya TaxID=153742 RepID=A0ABD2ZT15_9GENT